MMDAEDRKDLTISSWAILGIYIVVLFFGTLDFVRTTTLFAGILDQLGGELSWRTRLTIQLSDGIRVGMFILPIVAFVAFLIYKEIKWKSKIRALIVNNVVFLATLTIGYNLRVAMLEPMMNIIGALSR
jgi:type II secretory pathway component PulF